MKRLFAAICLGLGLLVVLTASGAERPWTFKPTKLDVQYADYAPGLEKFLTFDAYLPEGEGPFPGVVFIHGGGWRKGDKRSAAGTCGYLAAHGYAAFSINYRLVPDVRWPGNLYDCLSAVRYIREHAAEFKLDPARLAVMGSSAGGHLALMVGLADLQDEAGGQVFNAHNLGIKAVVSLWGPTDLRTMRRSAGLGAFLEPGADESTIERILAQASPITWVDEKDPPVLMIHGTEDRTVPFAQSEKLLQALEAVKVPAKLVPYEGLGHGLRGRGGQQAPQDWHPVALKWLDEYVKCK